MSEHLRSLSHSARRRLVRQYARAVIDGHCDTVSRATRDCAEELARHGVRSEYRDLRSRILRWVRSRRVGGHLKRWTPVELAVIERYANALVDDRYEGAEEAAEDCRNELAHLRQSRATLNWAIVPRSLNAIRWRIAVRARALGWKSSRRGWTATERRVCDEHADALAHGRFADAWAASAACRAELDRMRRQTPRGRRTPVARSLSAVHDRLARQTRALGWRHVRWLDEELHIMQHHASAMAGSKPPSLGQAAQECARDIRRLHDRLRRTDPLAAARAVPRTLGTIREYLSRLSVALGRPISVDWQPDEDRVVARYAQGLMDAKFTDASSATRACFKELRRLRHRWRTADPERYRQTRARTAFSTSSRLLDLAHRLERPWPGTSWTDKELGVVRRWVRWYERHRGIRRLRPWDTVITGIQEEIERLNSRRSANACQMQFIRQWHRVH